MKTINKGDTVYYTRVFPETGTYDLCDLIVRTVMDSWFCGVDKKTNVRIYWDSTR